jgi:hypothetical protein
MALTSLRVACLQVGSAWSMASSQTISQPISMSSKMVDARFSQACAGGLDAEARYGVDIRTEEGRLADKNGASAKVPGGTAEAPRPQTREERRPPIQPAPDRGIRQIKPRREFLPVLGGQWREMARPPLTLLHSRKP